MHKDVRRMWCARMWEGCGAHGCEEEDLRRMWCTRIWEGFKEDVTRMWCTRMWCTRMWGGQCQIKIRSLQSIRLSTSTDEFWPTQTGDTWKYMATCKKEIKLGCLVPETFTYRVIHAYDSIYIRIPYSIIYYMIAFIWLHTYDLSQPYTSLQWFQARQRQGHRCNRWDLGWTELYIVLGNVYDRISISYYATYMSVYLYRNMQRIRPHIYIVLCNAYNRISRDAQNHIHTVYIRHFWQENHHNYGQKRCI
jgi:hypothetical protein